MRPGRRALRPTLRAASAAHSRRHCVRRRRQRRDGFGRPRSSSPAGPATTPMPTNARNNNARNTCACNTKSPNTKPPRTPTAAWPHRAVQPTPTAARPRCHSPAHRPLRWRAA
eukprot:93449-Chlamydomonas_euryale.AAC.4